MIKIYKDNKGEVYILNYDQKSKSLGIRLSDNYWRNYRYSDLEEVKSIIIDNTKGKSVKIWGGSSEIKIFVPKFKSNIPHFIIDSFNGKRVVTKKSVYANITSAFEYEKLVDGDSWNIIDFIRENYKKVNTIKLRSSN